MIDDDDIDIFSIRRAIKQHTRSIQFSAIKYSKDFLSQIDNFSELPDAVLLDINMPVFNGFDVLDSIQRHEAWKQIPVIMLTTSEAPHDRKACLEAGAAAFLTKPSNKIEMQSVLDQLQEFF